MLTPVVKHKVWLLPAIAVFALIVAGIAWSKPAHKHRQEPPCSLRGSKTVHQDRDVRVYTKYYRDFEEKDRYACLLQLDRRVRLGRWYPPDNSWEHFDHLEVAAPYIAFHDLTCFKADCDAAYVHVVDLRTGAIRGDFAGNIGGLAVTKAGSAAWLDWICGNQDSPCVRELDPTANFKSVILDSGREIDGTSFAFGGRRVYWTKAGVPKSATLP